MNTEIVSPTPAVEEFWTDLEVGLASGTITFTLKAHDELTKTPEAIEVRIATPAGLRQTTSFNRQHVAWISEQIRRVWVDPRNGQQVPSPEVPHA